MTFKLSVILIVLPLLVASSTLLQSRDPEPPATCQDAGSLNCCTALQPITDIPASTLIEAGLNLQDLEGTTYGFNCTAVTENSGVCYDELSCCKGPKLDDPDATLNCIPLFPHGD